MAVFSEVHTLYAYRLPKLHEGNNCYCNQINEEDTITKNLCSSKDVDEIKILSNKVIAMIY